MFSRTVPNKSFSLYLFGSRARGEEENGSDADIAIVGVQINRADLSLIREQWEYSTIPMGMVEYSHCSRMRERSARLICTPTMAMSASEPFSSSPRARDPNKYREKDLLGTVRENTSNISS